MNRPSRRPSTTMRASSSSGCTGMPFSRSPATVIAGVVRGRSRCSASGRLRSDVHRPVSSRPRPDG